MTVFVDYAHTHMPLLRALWKDVKVRRRAIAALAELDMNEEIDRQAVNELLPDLSPHLTEEQRKHEWIELKYVLLAEANAWADGSGQPDDMSLAAWRDELGRRANEHLDVLTGVIQP